MFCSYVIPLKYNWICHSLHPSPHLVQSDFQKLTCSKTDSVMLRSLSFDKCNRLRIYHHISVWKFSPLCPQFPCVACLHSALLFMPLSLATQICFLSLQFCLSTVVCKLNCAKRAFFMSGFFQLAKCI